MIDRNNPAEVCARNSVFHSLVDVQNSTWVDDRRSMDFGGEDTTQFEGTVQEREREYAGVERRVAEQVACVSQWTGSQC
jgi:hypothetical protein